MTIELLATAEIESKQLSLTDRFSSFGVELTGAVSEGVSGGRGMLAAC